MQKNQVVSHASNFSCKIFVKYSTFPNTQIDEFYVSSVQYAEKDRNRFLTQRHSKTESDLWILVNRYNLQLLTSIGTFDTDHYRRFLFIIYFYLNEEDGRL